jgi:lambda family phage portal protein
MGILDIFRRNTSTPVTIQSAPRRSGQRNYLAAQNVARYGDMKSSRGSADWELRNSLAEVRSKARFLARNSGSMRRYIQLMKVNIVGEPGFLLQSKVKMLDGKLDITLNGKVEDAWRVWCQSPTVDGQMTMVSLLNQMVATWCRDGEVLWEIVYSDRYADGISVNPIEADLLDETLVTKNPTTGNDIRMGVEIDQYGRAVAYHLLTQHPGDLVWYANESQRRYRRIPAARIIHIYDRDRPGQTRGEPPAAAAINPVKMLDGYREAETMGRRLRAALMGFFTRILPKIEGISELADGKDSDDEVFEMDMEPGRLKQLPDGMDFKEFSPGGSVTDYADFEGQIKKDLSMTFGISVFSHGMETAGVSYSTGRTVVIEDRDFYKTMQRFFIDGGMRKLFPLWLRSHIVSDASVVPPSRQLTILANHVFRPRGWDWVDPAKDVKSNVEALRTMQTSLSHVAAQRGMDRDELLDQIKEDQEAAKSRGLTLDYSDGKAGAEQPEPDEVPDGKPTDT